MELLGQICEEQCETICYLNHCHSAFFLCVFFCFLYSVKTVLTGMAGLVVVWFWWFYFVLFGMLGALSFLYGDPGILRLRFV